MKLHLPHGLRKALVACMASLALALPTTLATASGTAGALAVFHLLSAPQAAAIDVDIDYGDATPYTQEETVTGAKWFSGITGDSVLHVQEGANLKLSTTGENGNLTLDMSGAINSLYFASDRESGGTFRFGRDGGKWQTADGTSIKDIYVDNAELWFDGVAVDLGSANVHLNGEIAGNAYSGALRGRNSASITIGGNLDVMGSTEISLQSGSNIIVNGELTGMGDLLLGVYNDVGGGAVQLHRGGTLNGQLVFWGDGASTRLVLGDTAADGGAVSLSVAGLASKTETEGEGGILKATGEATVVLTGSEEYTYRGKLGTEAAQTENGVGWTDASTLSLTVQLGEGGKQVLSGDTHLNNLTVSGGTLETAATVQVDGALNANGGTLTLGEGAMLILKATSGTIHLGTLNLTGNATLSLTGEQFTDLKLEATALPQDGTNKLHIALSSGFVTWLMGQSDGYQLFGAGGNWQDIVVFDAVDGHTVEWGSDGKITLAEAVPGPDSTEFTWTVAADAATFAWDAAAGASGTPWSTGEGTTGSNAQVTMTNDAAEGGATVTLNGEVQAGSLTLAGTHGFTFKAAEGGGGTLTLASCSITSGGTANVLVIDGANVTVTGGIEVTGGDGGSIKVVGGGSLAAAQIAGNANENTDYFQHGHASALIVGDESGTGTVTVGTEGGTNALLQVKHLEVTGEGSKVTVRGNLSSSYGDASSSITDGTVEVSGGMVQRGALTVDGGTLTVGGYYAGSSQTTDSDGGAINVSNGGSVSVGGGLHSTAVTLSGEGSTLTLTGANQNTVDVARNEEGEVVQGTGTLTLGAGTSVVLQGGTLTADTLNASEGGATLTVTLTADGGNLDISHLTLGDGGKLSITLSGYDAWANEHPEGGEYQLFNAEHFGTLWGELSANGGGTADFFEFEVDGQPDVGVTMDESGLLTFSGEVAPPGPDSTEFTWTVAADAATFTWDAETGASGTPWSTGEGATGSNAQVTMTNETAEGGAEVTLSGEVQAGDLSLGGAHGFTFKAAAEGAGSLALAGGLTLNTTLVCEAAVKVAGSVNGGEIAVSNGGSMSVGGGLNSTAVTLSGEGSKLTLTNATQATTSTVGSLNVGAGSTVEMGARQSLSVTGTLTMGAGVTLTMQNGTLTAETLDASAGEAGLTLTMTEGNNLDISHLTLGPDGKLRITLSGYADWVAGHFGQTTYQLFSEGSFATLWSELGANGGGTADFFEFVMGDGQTDLEVTLSETGELTFGGAAAGFMWAAAADASAFTWDAATGASGTPWTSGEGATDESSPVMMTNSEAEGRAEVTLSGDVKAGSLILAGAQGFTLKAAAEVGGSLTLAGGLTLSNTTLVCNAAVSVGGDLTGTVDTASLGDMVSVLVVDGEGASLNVSGNIAITDDSGYIDVVGGGRLESASIFGSETGDAAAFDRGYAPALFVGGENSTGTVVVGTEGGTGALLQVAELSVTGAGSDVTVWGDLSSASMSGITDGTVTVHGDMVQRGVLLIEGGGKLTVDGYYSGASNDATAEGGSIGLSNGGSMSVGGGLCASEVTLSGTGSKLTLADASQATESTVGNMGVGAGSTVEMGAQQSLLVTDTLILRAGAELTMKDGALMTRTLTMDAGAVLTMKDGTLAADTLTMDAGAGLTMEAGTLMTGKLTTDAGAELTIGSGTLTADTLDASSGGGSLTLKMTPGGNNLDISHLVLGGGGKVSITLEGYGEWAEQFSGREYQLFDAEHFGALWSELNGEDGTGTTDDFFTFNIDDGNMRGTLSETGALTFAQVERYTWEVTGGVSSFTWNAEEATGTNRWTTGDGVTDGNSSVTMTNETAAEGATVTITGQVQAWNVTFEGEHGFTLAAVEGSTLKLTGRMTVNTGLVCNADVTVGGGLSGTGNILIGSSASGTLTVTGGETVELGGWLSVAGGTFSAENAVVRLGGGLSSDLLGVNNQHRTGGTVQARSLETTVGEGEEMTYEGVLTVTETFTKEGAGTQVLNGGSLTMGSIGVLGGTLRIDGTQYVGSEGQRASLETGDVTVTNGGSRFEWQGGSLTAGSVTLSNGGQAVLSPDVNVTVSGTTEVSGAGSSMSVTGGDTSLTGGVSLSVNGKVEISGGNVAVGGEAAVSGASMSVTGGDMTAGSITLSNGGQIEVSGGNATVSGTTEVSGAGSSMKVTGDMSIASGDDVLVVNGEGASLAVTGSILASSDGGNMKVVGGGRLTAASLSGQYNGNPSYFDHGHAPVLIVGDESGVGTVTVGAVGGVDALLQVRYLEVTGAGSSVTVWGDLSSSYGEASSITGGTVKASGSMVQQGDLTINEGGTLEVGAGLHSSAVTLSGDGSKLTLTDATRETQSSVGTELTIGEGATVEMGTQQSLSVTGTLTMGAGVTLTMKDGTLTADTLDATAGGASLVLTMTDGGNNLDISHLTLGEGGKLNITLEGYGAWAATHPEGEDGRRSYQLFDEEDFINSLWNELSGGSTDPNDFFTFTVEGDSFLRYTLGATGLLTVEQDDGFVWDGPSGGEWGEGENWSGDDTAPGDGSLVTFRREDGTSSTDVQLAGVVTVGSGSVQVSSGEFTFKSSESGGSLTAKELIVRPGAKLNLQTTLTKGGNESMLVVLEGGGGKLGKLDARDGAVLEEGVKVQFKGGALVYSGFSAGSDVVSGNVDAEGSTDAARIEVGEGQHGQWGSESTTVVGNGGLTLALDKKGLVKSGGGEFTLAWQGDEQEHGGALTVEAGVLKLAVGGDVTARLSGNISGAGRLVISGGKVTLSGVNTVKEIELGAGSTTTLSGGGALGGAETTLILSGGTLTGNGVTAGAGTVDVSGGAVVSGVTLSGKVTGSAALTAADGAVAGLSGDVSGYSGTLNTGASGTWKLSGAALTTGAAGVAVGGDGTVQFDGAATYGGRVEGNVTLEGLGEEGLTVVSTESSAGAKLKGRVTLGNADTHAQWNGQEVVAEGSSVTLSNVTLAEGGGFTTKAEGVKFYVDTARAAEVPSVAAADVGAAAVPTGGVVDVSGMDAGKLDGIIINEHGRLTGVGGTYTAGRDKQLELHFSAENMGEMAEEGQALVEGRKGFVLDATSKYDVNLDMSNVVGSILEVLTAPGGGEVYLHLLQGGTLTMGELGLGDFEGLEIFESVVKKFGVRVIGGEIVLTGAAENVYMVTGGETMDAAELKDKRAIVFTAGKSATFTTGSEATLHNLLGESGSALRLQKGDGAVGEVTFILDNTHADDIIDADSYPEVDRTTVRGQDTKFLGSISGEAGVNVVKDGRGTLTVGGNYTLEDGSTTLRHGRLVLQGTENRMDKLVFDYNPDVPVGEGEVTEPQTEEQRGLVLDRGETFIGTISETGADRNGNEVQLQHGAKLTLSGASALSGTRIVSGDSSGTLTLQKATEDAEAPVLALSGAREALLSGLTVNVKDGATLTVSGTDAAVKGSKLNVENGTVQLAEGAVISDSSAAIAANGVLDLGGNAANQLTALSGSGTLKSAAGGAVTVGGGSFSGTLSSSEEGGGAGTLVVAAGANFTLDNVNTTAATPAWGVEVKDGAHLTIDVTKKGKENILTLGDINLGTGNTVTIRLNAETYDGWDDVITGNALTFGANTTVVLDAIVGTENWSPNRKLTLGKFESVSDTDNLKVQLKGAAFVLSQVQGVTWGEDHRLEVQLTAYQGNHFADVVPRGEKNVLAGAEMAWHSFNDRIANGTVGSGDYAMVMKGLSAMLEANDTAGLQRGLAAVAGASISTLAPAFSEDMHRQLTSIRNRTTTMASDVTRETYDKLPIWHAWINAESNYRKLDAEGLTPGYELNSWGGTVGVDADLNRHLTVGLAVTAMYGDLETESADSATGDLDTTYLSLFMRATHGSWIHTLVVSCGRADAELNRTIPYGLSTCRTSGTTDGYAYGVMYEVGYSRLVNKRETAALQPVFNVELRHVSLKGYTEFGSDIGLNTEDTDQTVVTFGAGARTQLAVGANAFNRTTVFEARALLKADVGDRSGTVRNAITGDSTRAEVESAEVGAVGVEIGAGLNVPLGAQFGSAFLDGSLEFRDGMTAANATIGYRVNF